MSAGSLSLACGLNRDTLAKFIRNNKLFREETLQKIEKFLLRQAKQQEQLTPLRQELRRAFEVERAAQKMRQDNHKPLSIQLELLKRVDKVTPTLATPT